MKRFLGDAAVVLVGILIGFLLLEGGIRIADSFTAEGATRKLEAVNALGHTIYTPNLDERRIAEDGSETLIHVFINSDGFVGRDYPKEKSAEVFRAIGLGDSFTAAVGVNTDKNFISLLEQELAGRAPAEFMNFGVGGQGTFEELIRYGTTASEWSHDLVVIFFYTNDFENNQFYLPYRERIKAGDWNDIPLSNANNNVGRSDLKYQVLKTSRLVQVLDAKVRANANLEAIAVKLGLHHAGAMGLPIAGIHPAFFMYQTPPPESQQEVFSFTGDILEAFKKEAESHGARLALVYVPEAVSVDAALFEAKKQELPSLGEYVWDFDQPQKALENEAKEAGIPFLDLSPMFRAAFAENPSANFYAFRDGHFTEEGHAFVAEAVLPFIESLRGR